MRKRKCEVVQAAAELVMSTFNPAISSHKQEVCSLFVLNMLFCCLINVSDVIKHNTDKPKRCFHVTGSTALWSEEL